MHDRDVTTIRELIYYQYAKIIARSALHAPDGTAAKGDHDGFIKQTFRELHKKLSTYLRTSPNLPLNYLRVSLCPSLTVPVWHSYSVSQ